MKYNYCRMKLAEFKHRFFYRYRYNRMDSALVKYKLCSQDIKKNKKQIKQEIALLKDFWGCYPMHYFRYELYLKEKKLSKKELCEYIPEFFFYRMYLPKFERKEYKNLLEEKNILEVFFKGLKIKTPVTVAKVVSNILYDEDMNIISIDEFIIKLQKEGIFKIFCKPIEGCGGHGIEIFSLNKDFYINENGEKFDSKYLRTRKTDYILQSKLEQEETINKIYPNSINTFRIGTENINGKTKIVFMILRLGRNGKQLDNSSQGGLVLGIDYETGKTADYAVTELCEKFYFHPDTNYKFKGTVIKNIDEIKAFVLENAKKIPYFTYIGWDIALTPDGPVAIEANLGFSLDNFQIPLGGFREKFKIGNPKLYWDELKH